MNYYKTERDSTYLFTVKSGADGETLFKAILDTGVNVHRWGRCRNRKIAGIDRKYGHVRLKEADRWDLYLKCERNCRLNDYGRAVQLLNNVAELIRKNADIIEYANPLYKETLESILSIKTSNMKQTPNKTSTWDVNLKSRIVINGTTSKDLDRHLISCGFRGLSDLETFEKVIVDEHTDLPLVEFGYNAASRQVRVVSKDEFYLTGYEENQYKKFRVDQITTGQINLVEMQRQ